MDSMSSEDNTQQEVNTETIQKIQEKKSVNFDKEASSKPQTLFRKKSTIEKETDEFSQLTF